MPMMMAAAAMVMTVVSSISASNAQRAQGAAQEQEKNYEANIANQNAGQVEASSQRDAILQNRETARTESNAEAAAAGSGGTSTDTTPMTNLASIQNEGDLRAATALYQGSSRAQALRNNAALDVYQGSIDQKSSNIQANTTLMNGAASLFSKYGSSFAEGGGDAGSFNYGNLGANINAPKADITWNK